MVPSLPLLSCELPVSKRESLDKKVMDGFKLENWKQEYTDWIINHHVMFVLFFWSKFRGTLKEKLTWTNAELLVIDCPKNV